MRKKLKTISSSKISKKNSNSPTVIQDVEYCRIIPKNKRENKKENKGENSMRNVVENEVKDVEEIVRERVKENENLFNPKELQIIDNNVSIVKKIYLLGLVNGRQIYGNKLQ